MRLAILLLVGAAYFLTACHQAHESAPQEMPKQLKAVETPVMPAVETTPSLAALASIQFAKVITIERPDDAQASELKLAPLTLKKRLPARAEVLLVPLTGSLSVLRTQVVKVTAMENPCSNALPRLFETELKPVKEKGWLSVTASFEVCVIFPVLDSVRALKLEELPTNQLPKKITPANIVVALDINNDQQPEVLLVEYCCDKPELDRKTCDLTCSAVYVREIEGQWRLIETQTPC